MNSAYDKMVVGQRANPYRVDADDRVLVLLDVRNITSRHSQDYSNTRIDYGKLLSDTIRGRKCVKAFAVDGIQTDDKGNDVSKFFHKELKNSGFNLILVPPSNNKGKQEGVDVEIALIAQRFALLGKCDVVELITGDGDFGILVKELQALGTMVNVTSFYRSLSYSLSDQADSITFLDDVTAVRMHPKLREAA